ncbi:hypothetical protein K439DRAFT_194330 [Ramaria rubella]|nr:hypothetical protein K439DRAFT_194330 [Ramaria rubella]
MASLDVTWSEKIRSEECLWSLYDGCSNTETDWMDIDSQKDFQTLLECVSSALGHEPESYAETDLHSVQFSASSPPFVLDQKRIAADLKKSMQKFSRSLFPLIPMNVWRLMMVIGAIASIIGYIGCFTIVQESQGNATGAYLWIGLEAALLRSNFWGGSHRTESRVRTLLTRRTRLCFCRPLLHIVVQSVPWRFLTLRFTTRSPTMTTAEGSILHSIKSARKG